MTRTRQKIRERFFAEQCAEHLSAPWVFDPVDRERPDFIVTEGDKRFGLEVCEIFAGPMTAAAPQGKPGSQRKHAEAKRQQVIDALRHDYEARSGGTTLKVRLLGDISHANLARVVPDLLAADLAGKPRGYRTEIDNDEGLRVHVTCTAWPEWFYIGDTSGFVDCSPLPRIVDAVTGKATELDAYRLECGDDVRLLVYANRIRNSGKLMLQGEAQIDRKGFSVIYFFSYPHSVIAL